MIYASVVLAAVTVVVLAGRRGAACRYRTFLVFLAVMCLGLGLVAVGGYWHDVGLFVWGWFPVSIGVLAVAPLLVMVFRDLDRERPRSSGDVHSRG